MTLAGPRLGAPHAAPQRTCPLYQESWRPQFHYSQPDRFMNDPNGLVYHAGEWHLFYQYRCFDAACPSRGISWGHAVSRDLLHWETLALAIPAADGVNIFSGSVVIDESNTSGFGTSGNPAMVAIYTAARPGNQSQALAYSRDNGRTFTKYEGNPVLDLKISQFRDPKVFWHEPTRRWVMVVAMPDDDQVAIYGSPDLKQWKLLSKWSPWPPVGGQYEVPDLFPLNVDGHPGKTKWVMIISTNPGGLWGGSLTAAYIGDFDGRTFKEDERYAYDGAPGTALFEGFESSDHGERTTTGTAFGTGPSQGSLPGQPLVNRYLGDRLPNSFHGGGPAIGTLTSRAFTISKRFINFRFGRTGSATTTVKLVLAGSVVRSATAIDRNTLNWVTWDVHDLRGRSAQIQIVDQNTTTDGRILVDAIGFSDTAALPGIERTPWFDWGKDNYAGITFDNAPDGRRLFVGWLNNWQYAQSALVPTTPWWRGQQSVPRELALRTIDGQPELVQAPLRELERLHAGKQHREPSRKISGEHPVATSGKQLDIRLTLRPGTASSAGLKVLTGANGDETVIGYSARAGRVYIDRTRSGAAANGLPGFLGVQSAALKVRNGKIDLRILIDHSIVEVFAGDGERVLTDLVYPAIASDGLKLFAEGGTAKVQKLAVYDVRSIWHNSTGASVP